MYHRKSIIEIFRFYSIVQLTKTYIKVIKVFLYNIKYLKDTLIDINELYFLLNFLVYYESIGNKLAREKTFQKNITNWILPLTEFSSIATCMQ